MVKEKIKTYKEWRGDIDSYLNIGDLVDDELVSYFIDVMPPISNTSLLIQMGEAYNHVSVDGKWRATYSTLHRHNGGWRYAGHCIKGENKHRG